MPLNRVQFQPGLSMPEFLRRYGTDAQCEAALQIARWPSGFACPGCGGAARTSFRRQGRLYWQCGACQHQCSVTSGTIFESTKLPLSLWFLAMHLLTQAKNNVSALELHRHLGVSYPTAWLMKHKLLEVMRQRADWKTMSSSSVCARLEPSSSARPTPRNSATALSGTTRSSRPPATPGTSSALRAVRAPARLRRSLPV